jgi:hypothetical protein
VVSAISVVSKFPIKVPLFKVIFGAFEKQWDWGLKSTAFDQRKQCF